MSDVSATTGAERRSYGERLRWWRVVPALAKLWDGTRERVGFVLQEGNSGNAAVGFWKRAEAAEALRARAANASGERALLLRQMAAAALAPPPDDGVQCVLHGWEACVLVVIHPRGSGEGGSEPPHADGSGDRRDLHRVRDAERSPRGARERRERIRGRRGCSTSRSWRALARARRAGTIRAASQSPRRGRGPPARSAWSWNEPARPKASKCGGASDSSKPNSVEPASGVCSEPLKERVAGEARSGSWHHVVE